MTTPGMIQPGSMVRLLHVVEGDRQAVVGARPAGNPPQPLEESMTQQAKSAINALRQSVDRLNQAKSDPNQLQQTIQEIQQQLQQLERQLDQDR